MIIGSNSLDGGVGLPALDITPEAVVATMKKRVEMEYTGYPDLTKRALEAYGLSGAGSSPHKRPPRLYITRYVPT